MKKIIIFLMLGMFLISLATAESIGTFKVNEDIQLFQTCNNCTFCNFTNIKFIPNSTILVSVAEATKTDTDFTYNLDKGNVSSLGQYSFNYKCGNGIDTLTGRLTFETTGQGRSIDTAGALVYILLTIAVFIFFLFSLYFSITVPYSNEINQKGAVIKITKLKYVKLGFFLLTYILFVWFLNVLIAVSDNFVNLTLYYGFISFLFIILNNMALPVSIFIIVLSFFEIIRDVNIQEAIKKFGSAK